MFGERTVIPCAECTLPQQQLPRLVLLLLFAACGGEPTTPVEIEPPVTPTTIHLASVDPLVPGARAYLRGSGFTGVRRGWVDWTAMPDVRIESDTLASFAVPHFRECETDGRRVWVRLEGADAVETHVVEPATVALSLGESEVLTAAELGCVRLPARDEDYVLSVANAALPLGRVESPRMLLRVSTLPSHPIAGGITVAHELMQRGSHEYDGAALQSARIPQRSSSPEPFDARYASAQPGDTVTMVAWATTLARTLEICGLPKAEVPTYPAEVIAASGNIVAIVDLRYAPSRDVIERARAGWLQRALDLSAPVLLRTMRSVFAADYEPFAGGGGRFYVLFTERAGGYALDGHPPGATGWYQEECRHASEMSVMSAPVSMLDAAVRDATLTSKFIIHEYAHTADMIVANAAGVATSLGLWGEAVAVLAEEVAARISSSQPRDARLSVLGDDHPWAGNAVDVAFWGRDPLRGPWQENGRYSTAATMLMFVRELVARVEPEPAESPTFYQRLLGGAGSYGDPQANIARITALTGLSYEQLTDRWMLASVTAGMLPAAAAEAAQLWDPLESTCRHASLSIL